MDIDGLYQGLRRIQTRGEIGNAYGGCGTVEKSRSNIPRSDTGTFSWAEYGSDSSEKEAVRAVI